jgi:hypothetical protein
LVELNEKDQRALPLEERKARRLEAKVSAQQSPNPPLRLVQRHQKAVKKCEEPSGCIVYKWRYG